MNAPELCERCGKYPRFQRKEKVYKLCAVCGWEAICKLLNISDNLSKPPNKNVTEALGYTPYEEWKR